MSPFDFLGRGVAFPVDCDLASGKFCEAGVEDHVRQSIQIILSTKKGERMMRPDFGCDIYNYAFGTMDYTSLNQMEHAVEEALVQWEPRIKDIQIRATPSEEEPCVVRIEIGYVMQGGSVRYRLTYPYSISDGTGGM